MTRLEIQPKKYRGYFYWLMAIIFIGLFAFYLYSRNL